MQRGAVRKLKGIFKIPEARINIKKKNKNKLVLKLLFLWPKVLVFGPHMWCMWKRTKQNEKVE